MESFHWQKSCSKATRLGQFGPTCERTTLVTSGGGVGGLGKFTPALHALTPAHASVEGVFLAQSS